MSLKKFLLAAAIAALAVFATASDAHAQASGYVCSVSVDHSGYATNPYTSLTVSLYSQGGCQGTYLGMFHFYGTDCANDSACNNGVQNFYRYSDGALFSIFERLSEAVWRWNKVRINYSPTSWGYLAWGMAAYY